MAESPAAGPLCRDVHASALVQQLHVDALEVAARDDGERLRGAGGGQGEITVG
jgi:hypothetical protein